MKSIILIQRTFRGSRLRIKLYRELVEQGYACKSVRFNRRLIGYKMWKLSHKIEDRVKKNELYLNNLMKQMEDKHEQSK